MPSVDISHFPFHKTSMIPFLYILCNETSTIKQVQFYHDFNTVSCICRCSECNTTACNIPSLDSILNFNSILNSTFCCPCHDSKIGFQSLVLCLHLGSYNLTIILYDHFHSIKSQNRYASYKPVGPQAKKRQGKTLQPLRTM